MICVCACAGIDDLPPRALQPLLPDRIVPARVDEEDHRQQRDGEAQRHPGNRRDRLTQPPGPRSHGDEAEDVQRRDVDQAHRMTGSSEASTDTREDEAPDEGPTGSARWRCVRVPQQPGKDQQHADHAEERHRDVVARQPPEVDQDDTGLPPFPLIGTRAPPRQEQRRQQTIGNPRFIRIGERDAIEADQIEQDKPTDERRREPILPVPDPPHRLPHGRGAYHALLDHRAVRSVRVAP